MKKYILPIIVVVALAAYIIWSSVDKNSMPVATAEPMMPAATSSEPTNTSNTASSSATTGQYKDGTYTGSVADAFYGNLQVSAMIQGGKLTNVQFLQYPHDQGESVTVNDRSNPILLQEAITSQNAQVDIVSGATQSSEAFQQSLASALAQAKI